MQSRGGSPETNACAVQSSLQHDHVHDSSCGVGKDLHGIGVHSNNDRTRGSTASHKGINGTDTPQNRKDFLGCLSGSFDSVVL